MTPPSAVRSQSEQTIVSGTRQWKQHLFPAGAFPAWRSIGALIQEDIMLTSDTGPAPESVRSSNAARTPFSGIGIPALKKFAHRTVMCAGVTAIGAMTMLFVKPELAERIKAVSPFVATAPAQVASLPHSRAHRKSSRIGRTRRARKPPSRRRKARRHRSRTSTSPRRMPWL